MAWSMNKTTAASLVVSCIAFLLAVIVPNNLYHPVDATARALDQARLLSVPLVSTTERGETEDVAFWAQHRDTLRAAWKEWEAASLDAWPTLSEVLDPTLYATLQDAVQNTGDVLQVEERLRELWTDTTNTAMDGVYSGQLLHPDHIRRIRRQLDAAAHKSGIPRRRPNGMNRYGMVLGDPEVDGAVHLHGWDVLANDLFESVLRPLVRVLFPYHVRPGEDEVESYAFTIRYREGEDTELKEHADAATVTVNININLPEEVATWPIREDEDDLFFVHPETQIRQNTTLRQPGQALIHRGRIRHGAYPGQPHGRMQLVIWLMGRHGYVRVAPYEQPSTALERWNNRRHPPGAYATPKQKQTTPSALDDTPLGIAQELVEL